MEITCHHGEKKEEKIKESVPSECLHADIALNEDSVLLMGRMEHVKIVVICGGYCGDNTPSRGREKEQKNKGVCMQI